MKNKIFFILFVLSCFFASVIDAQSLSSYVGVLIDLKKIKFLSLDEQEKVFSDKLGEPAYVSSFTTTTKYKDGKKDRVICDSYRYDLKDATITCFFMYDTGKLGQISVCFNKYRGISDYKKLFAIFGIQPPAKLNKKHSFPGTIWYNFDDYQEFTRIQIARDQSGFDSINFFIDRIE
jgi:hypothetical protein